MRRAVADIRLAERPLSQGFGAPHPAAPASSLDLGTALNRMKKAKDALKRFWTRARGIVKRDGGDGSERPKTPSGNALWLLIPLACALAASVAVFAILTRCEHGAYVVLPLLGASSCEQWSQTFGSMSTSAGVGFLVFLTTEVVTVILAQMWIDRQRDRAERISEMAQIARMLEVSERRADLAEQARREDAERAERMLDAAERRAESAEQARREDVERAERREQLLIELIASLKNGKDNGSE